MITYNVQKAVAKSDCVILPVWEDKGFDKGVKSIDDDFHGLFSFVKEQNDFEGKTGQVSMVYTHNKELPRVLLVGLGKQKNVSIAGWKKAVGTSVIACQGKKAKTIGIVLSDVVIKKFGVKMVGQETAVAVETANYSFDEHKSDADERVVSLKEVHVLADIDTKKKNVLLAGIADGHAIADGVNLVRQLGNTPPHQMIPSVLAKQAQKLGVENTKLIVKVLGEAEIKKLGMGCFLGVAQGSQHEPKFITIEYMGGKKSEKPTVLVGKGITFDSGGLSLKPSSYMCDMKFDMLGAATVIAIVKVAAALGLKKNIVVLAPTCENMPGGEAYRPDDILSNMEGITVEVDNTDAEGRMILCDALSYAKKYEPHEVIDFATLTGACMVALGNERSGLFSPVEKLSKGIIKSAETVGEQVWPLPLGPEFSEAMKSQVADIKNTGNVGGRGYAGASTAAAFLQHFTIDRETKEPSYPWAHIDLSSSYLKGAGKPWIRSGANGFGVQMMIEYLRD